jgi:HSP20 family protein
MAAQSPLATLAALLLCVQQANGGSEMFGDASLFDTLFDEFWRSDRNWRDVGGATSPWVSGIRSVSRGTFPPLNIGASPDHIHVYVFAAGLDPKSLDLSLQRNLLTVSGERTAQDSHDAEFYRRELFRGPFKRVITLPEDIDPSAVNAEYKDGVLHVRIGRPQEIKPRQIEIH